MEQCNLKTTNSQRQKHAAVEEWHVRDSWTEIVYTENNSEVTSCCRIRKRFILLSNDVTNQ